MQIHWIQFNLSPSETLVPTRINESLYPAITIFQFTELEMKKKSTRKVLRLRFRALLWLLGQKLNE